MPITYVNANDAKEEFSELLHRVSHNKERVILTRRGKEVAAIISLDDFARLQQSLSKTDLEEAVDALQEVRQKGAATLDDLRHDIE